MPVKKTRSTSGARSKTGSKTGRSKKSKSQGSSPMSIQRQPTMFDPPAVENLYYIAHSAVDALEIRGFQSSVAGGKKKKRGKKGKKK